MHPELGHLFRVHFILHETRIPLRYLIKVICLFSHCFFVIIIILVKKREGFKMTTQTPMMQQYLKIKKDYIDAFLFFRLGDFYELFHDDAIKAAAILEITLTSRKDGIPMCGVPHHSAQGYIETLISKGYKVAICEQVEDPKDAKGVVKREVVRLVTPGTIIEGKAMQTKSNYFIASADLLAYK